MTPPLAVGPWTNWYPPTMRSRHCERVLPSILPRSRALEARVLSILARILSGVLLAPAPILACLGA